jgi:hypothetical protein
MTVVGGSSYTDKCEASWWLDTTGTMTSANGLTMWRLGSGGLTTQEQVSARVLIRSLHY